MQASGTVILTILNGLHTDTDMPKRNSSLSIQEAEESSNWNSEMDKEEQFYGVVVDKRGCQEEPYDEDNCPDD